MTVFRILSLSFAGAILLSIVFTPIYALFDLIGGAFFPVFWDALNRVGESLRPLISVVMFVVGYYIMILFQEISPDTGGEEGTDRGPAARRMVVDTVPRNDVADDVEETVVELDDMDWDTESVFSGYEQCNDNS